MAAAFDQAGSWNIVFNGDVLTANSANHCMAILNQEVPWNSGCEHEMECIMQTGAEHMTFGAVTAEKKNNDNNYLGLSNNPPTSSFGFGAAWNRVHYRNMHIGTTQTFQNRNGSTVRLVMRNDEIEQYCHCFLGDQKLDVSVNNLPRAAMKFAVTIHGTVGAIKFVKFGRIAVIKSQIPRGYPSNLRTTILQEIAANRGRINLLLFGPPGVGKTSYLNTCSTTFGEEKFNPDSVPDFVAEQATGLEAVTWKLEKFRMAGTQCWLWNSWGQQPGEKDGCMDYTEAQLQTIVEGHLDHGFHCGRDQFNSDSAAHWVRNPNPVNDSVHGVILALSAQIVLSTDPTRLPPKIEKLVKAIKYFQSRDIPFAVIITNLDCFSGLGGPAKNETAAKYIGHSDVDFVLAKTKKILPTSFVYPVRPYIGSEDTNVCEGAEALGLIPLRHIVKQAYMRRQKLIEKYGAPAAAPAVAAPGAPGGAAAAGVPGAPGGAAAVK